MDSVMEKPAFVSSNEGGEEGTAVAAAAAATGIE